MAYLLDSNVLIDAKNFYYGFDLCPGYWEWLHLAHADGRLITIKPIQDELLAKDDELAEWVRRCPEEYFAEITSDTHDGLREVAEWANSQDFKQSAINHFLRKGDYFLVAFAKAHGHTVVTREVHSAGRSKIKIPTACLALGVQCKTPFELLNEESVRFELAK